MSKISEGHYYQKQLGCRCGVIAWSHKARFKAALEFLGDHVPRLLDYGCGDGTFLALAAPKLGEGCGADITPDQIAMCRSRLEDIPNLQFCPVSDLHGPEHDARYDVVTCMETLEHCLDPIVDLVLTDLARLVAPSGRVLISVPIEIGPTFLFKSVVRKVAARTSQPEYGFYENYTWRDALKMIFATEHTQFERPAYGQQDGLQHSHYGFNWRRLRARIQERFIVEHTRFSPLGFLGGFFSSQAWLICRPKDSPRA